MRRALTRMMAAAALSSALALGVSHVPDLLAGVEMFRVRGIRLEGTRFLTLEEVLASVELPPDASVWDDPMPWVRPLLANPLVEALDVGRDLPDSLVVRVTETSPVALVPTPTLVPVDADGRRLPIDPSRHRLDLPLLRPGDDSAGEAARLQVRPLAHELQRLGSADPEFVAMLSELDWEGEGDATALWGDPVVAFRFTPPLSAARLHEAMAVFTDATARFPDRRLRAVDLRYAEQVIVRF
ncbi:MAG TPA: FtsQ-type POTRA domain-containing protein [Longimicrobiales bacterium]|nr:FtsQ-type POTRA domain-containing protein [Longimicrobiales bacterium]